MGSITMASLIAELKGYGLDDPEVFEVMNFLDVGDILEALYPGRRVTLAADAERHLVVLMEGAAAKASLARRLEYRGVSPALGDALWAARQTRRKAQEAFGKELAAEGPLAVRGLRAPPECGAPTRRSAGRLVWARRTASS